MSVKAWKCRCAELANVMTAKGRFHKTSGEFDSDYRCAVKDFFMPIVSGIRQVGGWAGDCRNFSCESHQWECGKSPCKCNDPTVWCDQCITPFEHHHDDRCTCDPDLCPFFRERAAKEWVHLALYGRVPLLTRTGRVRPDAKVAKNHFKLTDEEFDALVKGRKKILARWKKAEEEYEAQKKGLES